MKTQKQNTKKEQLLRIMTGAREREERPAAETAKIQHVWRSFNPYWQPVSDSDETVDREK